MAANLLTPSVQCPDPVLGPGMLGIDRVAVDDANARLTVVFLSPVALPAQNFLLTPSSYTLTGGQRLFPRILRVDFPPPTSPPSPIESVILTLDAIGDFSILYADCERPRYRSVFCQPQAAIPPGLRRSFRL